MYLWCFFLIVIWYLWSCKLLMYEEKCIIRGILKLLIGFFNDIGSKYM